MIWMGWFRAMAISLTVYRQETGQRKAGTKIIVVRWGAGPGTFVLRTGRLTNYGS